MHRRLLLLLPTCMLTSCGLEAEGYLGPNDILIIPLSFGDVAPLAILCAVALSLLVQLFIPAWRRLLARVLRRFRRQLPADRAQLLATAGACAGCTSGLSLLPLCLALYADTFYPHIAGPLNPGKAIFTLLFTTCPMLLAGFLLVAVGTFCRWLWLRWRGA